MVAFFNTQAHRRALCGGAPLLALCLWADSRVRLHRRRRLFLPAPPEGEAPVSRLHPAAHQGVSRSRDAVGGRDGPEKTVKTERLASYLDYRKAESR